MDKIFIRNREVATKEYVDAVAGGGASVDLSNYYTKEEMDNKGYVTQDNMTETYYTKEEADAAIAAAITTVLEGEY